MELELGRLWSIAEVWVNGEALGVVRPPPFAVDCTEGWKSDWPQ